MQYDIIIIGGGMVGASLACALRDSPLRIALVDATPLPSPTDHRLIALNRSSYCLFKNLNLWSLLSPHAAPIKEVHVSDRGHFGKLRLTAREAAVDALGYVVPAHFINEALQQAMTTQINLTLLRPATLSTLLQSDHSVSLTVETAQGTMTLSSHWVMGADGTHSTVRQLLQIPTDTIESQQSALVTITDLQRPHHHIAYERFHRTGAVAMLPLTDSRSATIWTDDNARIQALMQMSDVDFLQALQTQFGYRLGRLQRIGKRYTYPLQQVRAEKNLAERVILLGNAAHTLLPLAAQGLNLALAEIAMLAQCFAENPTQPNWSTYHGWQQKQQNTSTQLSHQLPKWFSHDSSFVTIARQIGLVGLDICPLAKKRFAWHAMGKTGPLPPLLIE